jgi:ATP-binding cassette subfamily C protein
MILTTLRRCIAMLPSDYRRWWVAVPIIGLVTGATEAGAAATMFALIKVIGAPTEIAAVPIAGRIAPWLPSQEPNALVLEFTLLVVLYLIAKNLLAVWTQYLRHRIVSESSAELGCTMLRGYLLAPYPFHFRRNSAELIRNTTDSVSAVLGALNGAAALLSEVLVGVGIVAVLLAAAPIPTLVVGVLMSAVVVLLLRWTRAVARRMGHQQHHLHKDLLQTLQHSFGGIKEIKALGREGFFYRTYAEQQRAFLDVGQLGVTLQAIPPLVIETVFVCGALLVIAMLTVTGRIGSEGLPLLGMFAYAAFRIIPMANRITWRLNELRAYEAPVGALHDDYRLLTGQEWMDEGTATALDLRRSLDLEHVSYSYPEAAAPALHDVSLTVRRGESLGFVGPTGAGKSTLVDVIVGLLPPSTGRITLDGTELAPTCSRAWRRHIGYVPQSIFLLDDTLRRNVALGIADPDIDEARVREAIRLARLEPVVAGLPNELDTVLGEGGARLSGGERQRVGIARALYHDPAVLVFDEATSALDAVTEAEITDSLRALHGQKTVLVIAHRLSTVRGCDRIAVLAGGRVVDCGAYDELAARNEEFRRLVRAADPSPARRLG